MRNSKQALKRLAIALGALLLVSAVGLAQVTVSLPTVTSQIGTTQLIPITVGDLTGLGVISFQFTVTYNSAYVNITEVTTTGALAAVLNAPVYNTGTPGQITVAAAGQSALAGSGKLIYLKATMVGKGSTTLHFSDFSFNEGTPASTPTDGLVMVPSLSVKVSDISVAALVGGTFTLPITTESVTGQNALSYQFTVSFDPTKINLNGASITNTMSSGFGAPVYNTTVPGALTVAAAGQTALTGSGTLINLVGTVVAVGSSTVGFTSFQYNEGTPAAGGVDGSVAIVIALKPVLNSRIPTTVHTVGRNVPTTFSVDATDLNGGALVYTWKLNDAVVLGPGPRNSYVYTSTDPHGTARKIACVFATAAGLSDSTWWNFTITGIADIDPIPAEFALGQNYPNPFNPTTQISYSLPKEASVTFEIYNMLGVKVRTLMAGEMKGAGQYTTTWDGKDNSGVTMPTGIYLYRIQAGSFVASKKMTLLK